MSERSPEQVVVRPIRARWVCWGVAATAVALFSLVATALRGPTDGGAGVFGAGDQVAMVGLGFLVAAGALVFTRPRVIADSRSLRIRNVVTAVELPWQVVRQITFDDRSPWASVELLDDDQVAMVAIQAVDGQSAVVAVRALRELMRAAQSGIETPAR